MSCPSFIVAKFPNGSERIDNDEYVRRPHYLGNTILVYGRKSGRFPYHMVVGPDWPCMLVTYMLIVIPTFFFVYDVGFALGWWVMLLGSVTGISVLIFFTLTACSDPGVVLEMPKYEKVNDADVEDQAKDSNDSKIDTNCAGNGSNRHQFAMLSIPPAMTMECGTCSIKRPTTASHCYECGLCIDEIDHHCPWTGKCIAKKNIRTFWWFLSLLSVHILLVIIITIYAALAHINVFKLP